MSGSGSPDETFSSGKLPASSVSLGKNSFQPELVGSIPEEASGSVLGHYKASSACCANRACPPELQSIFRQ
jgi:hypothetical protein